MKKVNLTCIKLAMALLLLITVQPAFSQLGVGINATGASADSSAMLDVVSTTKGAVLPRMTLGQMNAIVHPSTALIVYVTDVVVPGYYYYDGTQWVRFSTSSGTGSNSWSLTGNSGTAAGTNFIGTTDANDFVIKTNNVEGIRLYSGNKVGAIGIGAGPTPTTTSNVASWVLRGLNGNMQMNVQDGGARASVLWNATGTQGAYETTGEPAGYIGLANNGTTSTDINFYSAAAGTAGNTITWTQLGRLSGSNQVWFSPRANSADFNINSSGNIGIGTSGQTSKLHIVQPVSTSGSPTAVTITGGAHTTLAASTEATDVTFGLNRTVQFTAGAIGNQRAVRVLAPTYSFDAASTITSAATFAISGAPVAGTNATITNAQALRVEGGNTFLNGNTGIGSANPTFPLQIGLNVPFTTSSGNVYGILMQPTFSLSTNPINSVQGIASNYTVTGSSALTNMLGYYTSPTISSGYSSTITNVVDYWAADITNNSTGTVPATNYFQFRGLPTTNGNGITSGTVSNYGLALASFTAAAAGGGTVNNYTAQLSVPTGSGAGTTNNYGLQINGGSAAATNWSFANNSSAQAYFTGNLGIGNSAPGYKVTVTGDGTTDWKNSALVFQNNGSGGRNYSISSRASGLFQIGDETAGSIRITMDASGNVGIGTLAGTGTRMVQTDANGTMAPLAAGTSSQVLLGTGVWGSVPAGGPYWSVTGNATTSPATNFVGTTDAVNFAIRVNSANANGGWSGFIDQSGKGITLFGYLAGAATAANNNSSASTNNSAFGATSLTANTFATQNTALGSGALATQSYNGGGAGALYAADNTAVGYQALNKNQPTATNNGFQNTAVGSGALFTNTTGSVNTAVGYQAMNKNATGVNNTAVGQQSLFNSTGSNNTAVGQQAMLTNAGGSNNTAIGVLALDLNVSGNSNTAVGLNALLRTTGGNNTGIGTQVLQANTSGTNTAVGYQAMFSNTTGSNNVAFGSQTFFSNVFGSQNVAIGDLALNVQSFGASAFNSDNVAVGYRALYANQPTATSNGIQNTAIGNIAGYTTVTANANTTGSGNTYVGYAAGPGSATQFSNSTAIGANATVTQSNSLILGSISGVNNAAASVSVGIGTTAPASILHTVASGAKTANYFGNQLNNTATSSTASIFKAGLAVSSTGTWNGASAVNEGLIIQDFTSGTAANAAPGNYGIVVNAGNSGNGLTSGTVSNSGMLINAHTAGAGNGGTINNYGLNLFVPAGAATTSGTTSNYGLFIQGDGGSTGTGTVTNYSIYDPSAAPSYFAGNVGIGCASAQYKLHVVGDLGVVGTIWATAATVSSGVSACSDIRYKKDIASLPGALDNVLKLRGVNYFWKKEEFPEKNFTDKKQVGVIAQELEKVYPELVFTDKDGYKSVDYSRLTPVLVEAIKEQQKMIDSLKSEKVNLDLRVIGLEEGKKELELRTQKLETAVAEIKNLSAIEAKATGGPR